MEEAMGNRSICVCVYTYACRGQGLGMGVWVSLYNREKKARCENFPKVTRAKIRWDVHTNPGPFGMLNLEAEALSRDSSRRHTGAGFSTPSANNRLVHLSSSC